VPRRKLDDEVFPRSDEEKLSDQQKVDPFDNGEYHPNDPRNW